jgi:hypothetical protein
LHVDSPPRILSGAPLTVLAARSIGRRQLAAEVFAMLSQSGVLAQVRDRRQ